ncbi:gamma-glutamyltransferase [Polynucleobacter sp. IMCC 30228]|uniref:gamma-glutamyltransferase n=1 Tax=Polynucleobacter sp. IMCC 30228 TaxID=2781011 RepID=UPI001F44CA75|nr:gamma-glutamyltransferase [Polynucleobacter sp. IMCC 30228]MCE7527143.1 gamma-glutamyltransferase [Polynucleobacter sp. IMCC 30228]
MVTSPHELATQAGLNVLQSGGNAIEAVIAISSCLSVTYPHFSGYGGDAFVIISDANGKAQTISGIGQAPQDINGYSGSIPFRGPKSMLTSAAYVDTLGKAYEISKKDLKGQKSWASLLSPAIKLAKDGFPVSESEVFWLNFRLKEMGTLPGVESGFLIDGKVPTVGQIFKQAKLAKTIEMIAEYGPRDFYEGKLAAILAKGLKDVGSPITAKDLALTQAQIEPPLSVQYRGGTLLANQPPTQGITTLEIMGILERFDLSKIPEGSPDYYHLLVEAVKLAFIDRNKFVADPKFVEVPSGRLLSSAYLDAQAKKIKMNAAMPWPYVYKTGDTVFLAAVDAQGNCASMLTTIYYDWGSGMQVGDTGMIWHNRGASFSLDPKSLNRLEPGKRPFHTLNPGMYMKNGKPNILYGTQGADGQPQTLAAVLTRLIDYKMDPLTALAKPRFLLGKTFSDTRDSLKLEQDAGDAVFVELGKRGHEMSVITAQSPLAGHPGAIVIDQQAKQISGAHDPRSDGRALGL